MTDIQLIHADCLSYLASCDACFDLVVADPPYSSGGMTRGDRTAGVKTKYLQNSSGNQDKLLEFLGDTRDQRSYFRWSWLWMTAVMERMKDGAIIGIFTDWRQLPTTTDAVQCAGLVWRGIVPWWKPSSRPQPNRYSSACEYIVWATKGPRGIDTEDACYAEGFYRHQPPQDRIHVTEKPVELYRHLYKLVPNGGGVLDPFLGSAASAIAAYDEARGLQFVGCELSKDIYTLAMQRLAAHRSQTRLFDSPNPSPTQLSLGNDMLPGENIKPLT